MDGTLTRITTLMKEQKILDQDLITYLGLPRGALQIGGETTETLIIGTLIKSQIDSESR